jgi:hypothetical protein
MKVQFTQIPSRVGASMINENPIDVVEKLGKYEFIYDYNAVPAPIFYKIGQQIDRYQLESNQVASATDTIAPIWAGLPTQPTINPNPQVGVFSKGNVVNVIRFDGNYAVIENPNYVEPVPDAPKVSWFASFGDITKQKEISIPKEYLSKVDDLTPVTVSTGINYGANMKPQPVFVSNPIKSIPNKLLESNTTYYLKKDFQYTSGSHEENCQKIEGTTRCQTIFDNKILKAGDKVVGDLIETCGVIDKVSMGIKCSQFLSVNTNSQFGDLGHTLVPIEYLTKELPTNSNSVVPVKNNDKNILMIAGAFLVGYLLFNKGND